MSGGELSDRDKGVWQRGREVPILYVALLQKVLELPGVMSG
jgi:hypothetical protein